MAIAETTLTGIRSRLGRSEAQLFLTSASVLLCELALIRWIPANVAFAGYFSNFVLMGSFLGIGLGILLAPTRLGRSRYALFPPLLLAMVMLVLFAQFNVQVRSSDDVFFGLSESSTPTADLAVLPLIFGLSTMVLAALAMPLGPLLRALPPLRAYAVDIAGSIAGIGLFALLSVAGATPTVWFAALALLLGATAWGHGLSRRSISSAAFLIATVALLAQVDSASGDLWSPYYRVTVGRAAESGATVIYANGIGHQFITRPADVRPDRFSFYDQVYRWYPERHFGRALVIGAGTGSDVAFALAHGVDHVDAVEIDPRLRDLGFTLDPDRPYQDPRVRTYVNDGRAFLRDSSDRYDLIIFALPDSLTLVSQTADLRLESYLFTLEAFQSARDHLSPNGVFVLYNFFRRPWLVDRYAAMLERTFDRPPLVVGHSSGGLGAAVLAVGPPPAVALPASAPAAAPDPIATSVLPTDAWPFPYLRSPGIPAPFLVALGAAMLVAALAVLGALWARGGGLRTVSPYFAALGAAFMLLETRSLATFGLLFGTTWAVNALVFAAILASVLLAIAVNARPRRLPVPGLFVGLFGSLAVAFAIPPDSLLFDPAWLRYVVASAVAFAPVFFANLVFTRSFRDTRAADLAFASNLVGAMAGGVLEYLALVVGYQELLLVAAAVYALAWLAGRARLGLDAQLEL